MNLMLSQKASAMLEEAKSAEELCVRKYTKASQEAQCPQLSQLFSNLAQQESNHLNLLNQMIGGTLPQFTPHVSATQGIANQQQPVSRYATEQSVMENAMSQTSGQYNQDDKALLEDLLKDEKFMSDLYSTAIFEQTDGQARTLLNTIQSQEQEHGKMLYDYMNSHGVYAVTPAAEGASQQMNAGQSSGQQNSAQMSSQSGEQQSGAQMSSQSGGQQSNAQMSSQSSGQQNSAQISSQSGGQQSGSQMSSQSGGQQSGAQMSSQSDEQQDSTPMHFRLR